MKKIITFLIIVTFLASCASSVSIHQAANNNYKKSRSVR